MRDFCWFVIIVDQPEVLLFLWRIKMPIHPTAYPEINSLLNRLLGDVQATLGETFTGMYLFGSLAGGEFDPRRSDIDFAVVTTRDLPEEMLPTLAEMHTRITTSGLKWATKLEGSYIPLHALRRYDPSHARHPALHMDGSFDLDQHGSDWIILRHLIREQGIVLAGPDPRALIDPVRPDDLRRAAAGVLQEWWLPQLQDHTRLQHGEYQAYAILTMCRILYTLQHGSIASKPAAARWAQEALGKRWAALIGGALAWQPGMEQDNLDEALEFIRYTWESARQYPMPSAKHSQP